MTLDLAGRFLDTILIPWLWWMFLYGERPRGRERRWLVAVAVFSTIVACLKLSMMFAP